MLRGDIARRVGAALRGRLLRGRLRRLSSPPGGALDEHGDPLEPVVDEWRLEGFVDTYDARYRAQAGIPETAVKVLIITTSLPDGVAPVKGDMVMIRRGVRETWYRVAEVSTDPAEAMWECQATVEPAPGLSP